MCVGIYYLFISIDFILYFNIFINNYLIIILIEGVNIYYNYMVIIVYINLRIFLFVS